MSLLKTGDLVRLKPTKAGQDDREYRSLQLPNGLKVVLVSDPTSDKAAASLDVHVG